MSEALMAWCNSQCRCTYVEDGAGAYNSVVTSKPPKWKQYLDKLVFGPWYDSVEVYGESIEISRIAATFPNKVRPELRHLEKYRVKPDYVREIGVQWANKCIKQVSYLPHPIQNIETIFFMEKYRDEDRFPKNHKKETLRLINNRINKGHTVGVKYHPAEENHDYLNVRNIKDVVIVPKNIPSELAIYASNNLNNIIGMSTTSLLSSKWMLEDISVMSTAKMLGYEQDRYLSVMEDIGVKFI